MSIQTFALVMLLSGCGSSMPAELTLDGDEMSGRAWLDDDGQMRIEAKDNEQSVSIIVFEPDEEHRWWGEAGQAALPSLQFLLERDGEEPVTEEVLQNVMWLPEEGPYWESQIYWGWGGDDPGGELFVVVNQSAEPEEVLTYSCTWDALELCQTWDRTPTQAQNQGLEASCDGDFGVQGCSEASAPQASCTGDGTYVVFYEPLCASGSDPYADMRELCESGFSGSFTVYEEDGQTCPE